MLLPMSWSQAEILDLKSSPFIWAHKFDFHPSFYRILHTEMLTQQSDYKLSSQY